MPLGTREGRGHVARSPVRVTLGDSAVVTPLRSPSASKARLLRNAMAAAMKCGRAFLAGGQNAAVERCPANREPKRAYDVASYRPQA